MSEPNNECGECRMCCIELPINEPELQKTSGIPCRHLCDKGCSLHGTPEQPSLCRQFRCGWRQDSWLGQRPDYRPDRLGVIFQADQEGVLSLFECWPGAFEQEKLSYIMARIRKQLPDFVVKWFGYGCAHGAPFLDNGEVPLAGGTVAEGQGTEVRYCRRALPMIFLAQTHRNSALIR